jgi:hypothetical protein
MEYPFNQIFKVKVDDSNTIVNLKELIDILDSLDIDEEIESFLTTLNNNIKYSNINNKDELSNVIESKLLSYKSLKEETKMDNKTALQNMQSVNEDLNKLSIISTSKLNNDSKKDIDYLTYVNESNEVEVLVCAGDSTLNDYIKQNASKITTMSAYDIFHHFKEYVHKELSFDTLPLEKKSEDDLPKQKEEVKEDEIKELEYEEVKKYADKFSISDKIEVSVDPNGERIYRVKDGLFKFRTVADKREMVILQTPSINLDNTFDLLNELDDENVYSTVKEIEPKNTNYNDDLITYDSLNVTSLSKDNIDEFMELVQKRDVYGAELTSEEMIKIDCMIKTLIESMVERIKNNTSQELDLILSDYIEKLKSKVDDYKDNYDDLSKLDQEFITRFDNNMELLTRNNLINRNNKKLELKDEHKISEQGLTTIIMLIEIMILALFILMFSHIDI